MIRLIGSVMIGVVCAAYGFDRAAALKRRRDFLREFLNSLAVIEAEISFGRATLGEIFKKTDAPELFGLYSDCAKNLSELGIKKAWQLSAEHTADAASLYKAERDAIYSFGAELGKSDVEGHKKSTERITRLASAYAEAAEDEYRRMGRVWRSMGVLAGTLFVLICI